VTGVASSRLREPLLDAARLAEILGVTRRWVYAQVEEHGMPAYRLPGGRQLLFELSAVEAWLAVLRIGDWEPCGEPGANDGLPSNVQRLQVG
jgi:excisionase family DNA binding protein